VPAIGIEMNNDNPLVARHDQLDLIKASVVGLFGGFKWRRLGKKQCAGVPPQGARGEYDQ
jgi:hypothetical protein